MGSNFAQQFWSIILNFWWIFLLDQTLSIRITLIFKHQNYLILRIHWSVCIKDISVSEYTMNANANGHKFAEKFGSILNFYASTSWTIDKNCHHFAPKCSILDAVKKSFITGMAFYSSPTFTFARIFPTIIHLNLIWSSLEQKGGISQLSLGKSTSIHGGNSEFDYATFLIWPIVIL